MGIASLAIGINGGASPSAFVCSAISALFGGPILLYGFKLRNRVAIISTAYKQDPNSGWTSVTETAMPSFLKDDEEEKEP
jgi:hypothetical protein